MKWTFMSFFSCLYLNLADNSSTLIISSPCWLFLLPVKPLHQTTLPAANCQNPMDLCQRWYTHTLLSQHKPLCIAKLQNRCQAIQLHSGGPFQRTLLSVDTVYLSCLVLRFQMLLFSLAALVKFFFLFW